MLHTRHNPPKSNPPSTTNRAKMQSLARLCLMNLKTANRPKSQLRMEGFFGRTPAGISPQPEKKTFFNHSTTWSRDILLSKLLVGRTISRVSFVKPAAAQESTVSWSAMFTSADLMPRGWPSLASPSGMEGRRLRFSGVRKCVSLLEGKIFFSLSACQNKFTSWEVGS